MDDTRTADRPASAQVLDYGHGGPRRWPKRLLWAASLVAVLAGGYLLYGRAALWFARQAGTRNVVAWYQQARTSRTPEGTLLYSENPSDFALGAVQSMVTGGVTRKYVAFDTSHPLLARAYYTGDGVPVLVYFGILFVHERRMWHASSGSRDDVVSVAYIGLGPFGHPQFDVMAMNLGSGKPPFPAMGGIATTPAPGRAMANLRVFAGRPDPADPTRFALPFQCDGGSGRFQFKTDDDVSDGGKIVPDVWIEWDGTPAATRPGALPGAPPHERVREPAVGRAN